MEINGKSIAEHVLCRFMVTAVFSRCILYPRVPYQQLLRRNTEVERRVSDNFNATLNIDI